MNSIFHRVSIRKYQEKKIEAFPTKKNPLKNPSIFAIITNVPVHGANIL